MPDPTPAQTLTAAMQALQDPNADACQMLGCWHADELHRQDADGVTWCADCMDDQHPHMVSRTAQVPQWLRRPLADSLRDAADGDEHGEYDPYALAVARAILTGGDQ